METFTLKLMENKTAGHVLLEIIRNTPLVVIHIENAFALIQDLEEETGVKVKAKNIQDEFQTQRGYIWSRQNKRKFQLSIA